MTPADKVALMRSRLSAVKQLTNKCRLCPRECNVNRSTDELGTCRIGHLPVYSSANLHHGEEPPISGTLGSGTIFLTGCNLRCLFCQNYPISQHNNGKSATIDEFAEQMLMLQHRGAHNINFVSPTHQSAAIFESLLVAYERGLTIPIVYNSGGYESLEMLRLWDGIIDVYMPDSKYGSDVQAVAVSKADDYTHHNRIALKEMHRQVGILRLDDNGIAVKGLIIRHLVLPGRLSSSTEVLRFIAEELSPYTYISLMSQYFPAHNAHNHPVLKHKVSLKEYDKVVDALEQYGLENGWTQPF